jgi:hypothetical protein
MRHPADVIKLNSISTAITLSGAASSRCITESYAGITTRDPLTRQAEDLTANNSAWSHRLNLGPSDFSVFIIPGLIVNARLDQADLSKSESYRTSEELAQVERFLIALLGPQS